MAVGTHAGAGRSSSGRRRTGLAMIIAGLGLAVVLLPTIRAVSDESAGPPPTPVPSATASSQSGVDQEAQALRLTDVEVATAKSLALGLPALSLLAPLSSLTATNVLPWTDDSVSTPFRGAIVEISLPAPVVFPPGVPVLKSQPEVPDPSDPTVPLADRVTLNPIGPNPTVSSIEVFVDLSSGVVIALGPGSN